MEPLTWHERLIERMITRNSNSTIKDYFNLTDGYKPEVPEGGNGYIRALLETNNNLK